MSSPLSLSSSSASLGSRSGALEVAETRALTSSAEIEPISSDKDLSFLLDAGIYHPLGQIDVPQALRQPFPGPLPAGSRIQDIFVQLENLLAQCHFLGAAHICGLALTSGNVSPSDYNSIFRLLSVRYSALALSGNVLLAAQESKALEDLASTFYYHEDTLPENHDSLSGEQRPLPRHIMPFDLRLQAIRLQSIGFSDLRRGISALYDVGLECRQALSSPVTQAAEAQTWTSRLEEIGFRVVNSLIEMGDLDCARRTLHSMKPIDKSNDGVWAARMMLLLLKMGDVSAAEALLREMPSTNPSTGALRSIILTAQGRYGDAVQTLAGQLDKNADVELQVMVKQNLAVAYLYTGQLSKCRSTLEQLIDENQSYRVLVTNLATLYELSSDKARKLKLDLVDRVAARGARSQSNGFVNADFRL